MLYWPDTRSDPQVASVMARYSVTFSDLDTAAYAAIQVWAQAAEKARSLQLEPMVSPFATSDSIPPWAGSVLMQRVI